MPSFRGPSGDHINKQVTEDIILYSKNPIVKRETLPSGTSNEQKIATNRQTTTPSNRIAKIERNDENGNFHVKRVSIDLAKQIQQSRQNKGWSQKDLASRAQIPIDIVRNYERGTAITNGNYTSKLRRILGI